ncbi:MAG: M14 family metallopeptidase [Fimbriimonadaceae bacterium]|nr:M14 family metallopeptidase [Fimbriimonadaceae bacterium]
MPKPPLDRYIRYEELTDHLQALAAEHPGLVRLEELGRSWEGRPIWLVVLNDESTGADTEKPAFWVDGNIHASEVSASTACLAFLDLMLGRHRDVLKDRAVYVCPRLNPDGAEWALADKPKIVRSSTRPHPFDENDPEGLEREDIDGDGRILQMRVPDPNGPWCVSEEEPRLLRRRRPEDRDKTFYRVLPGGLIHGWDGMTLRGRRVKEGLDLNRQYPSGWRGEHEQKGAGLFPAGEPEIRAQVDFITRHPNICGAVTFHTYSGVLLRPPGREPEDNLPPEDVWIYREMGAKGTEMTGYPAISVFHDFKYHPKEVITGVFDDWMYEHRGVHAWTVEIWSPQRQAGITEYKYIDWFRDHPFSDDLKMLAWSDSALGGRGYVDWKPFEHPQLGPVEIGGWDALLAFRNPPPEFLQAEVTPLAEWTAWLVLTGPRLVQRSLEVAEVDGLLKVRWAVQNSGWLPTQVTKLAADRKLCRGVVAEILAEGEEAVDSEPGSSRPAWLVAGDRRTVGGQLKGWSDTPAGAIGYSMDDTSDVQVFEWILKPGRYRLTARHERAGVVRAEIGG